MKIRKMLLLSKSFLVSISFSVSIGNHPWYQNKEKMYKLFVFNCKKFPIIDKNEHKNEYIIIVT